MSARHGRFRRAVRGTLAAAACLAAAAAPLAATEVKIVRADTAAAFLGGTLEGISVDPLGTLRLADRVDRLTALSEPFVFAAAPRGDGWVVGTGNSGRVLAVDRKGNVRALFQAPEPEIFAVMADPDGTVWAASSPDGKVYRIGADGKGEPWFEPHETYVWALARAKDGSLLVATGTQGKLYRVTGKGKGEVLLDSDDTHLRSLLVLPDGDVVVGTAGEGKILRRTGKGTVETLYDADQPEIVSLATDGRGTVWAAALSSEASFVDLSPKPKADAAGGEAAKGGEAAATSGGSVEVSVEDTGAAGSRPAGAKGPRTAILRIPLAAAGGDDGRAAPPIETVATLEQDTAFSLLWLRDRLWIGTGLDGKLYSLGGDHPDSLVLEADVDERQIVALVPDTPGPAFVSTNAAALYRAADSARRSGTYTSSVLDAGGVARWGTFHWQGETPGGASVRFAFRTGAAAEPDKTWSPWTAPKAGDELPLAELPRGRYFQWRGELAAPSGKSPRVQSVDVSYRQENLRPRIAGFAAMEPGQILVPSNFNPSNQVYEPASPDRSGMFTVLESAPESGDSSLKTLWKKGFRTLRWKASDPNGDQLGYRLSFRRDGDGGDWMKVAHDLEEGYYAFDATALPDGDYRFRLEVDDEASNEDGGALTAERVSEPVLVDNTPPAVAAVDRRGSGDDVRLEVEVVDRLSPLRKAEVSVDAGEWKDAEVADGLLDGRRETLRIALPKAARMVLVRLTDAAWNVTTVDVAARAAAATDRGGER